MEIEEIEKLTSRNMFFFVVDFQANYARFYIKFYINGNYGAINIVFILFITQVTNKCM